MAVEEGAGEEGGGGGARVFVFCCFQRAQGTQINLGSS